MSGPSDLERLVPGLVLLDRLRTALHTGIGEMEWVVPPHLLRGVTAAYGLPVRHVDGIEAPYLAHRLVEQTVELPL